MEKISVVIRSFQPNADHQSFNLDYFKNNVEIKIRKLLNVKCIKKFIIISNGDTNSQFSEKLDNNGLTPTCSAVYASFEREIRNNTIGVHICSNWGLNPGSATALNEGIQIAEKENCKWVLCWSPELVLDENRISNGLELISKMELDSLGFLRELWWEKTQWNMVQNTGAIWKIETLKKVNYFDDICNGTGETISIDGMGKVLLAGMEDFHALLKIYSASKHFKWCMYGLSEPLKWVTDFGGDKEREKRFNQKVARQFGVMKEYVKRLFPSADFYNVMGEIYKRYSVY
jgi:hypothetical protein